MADGKHEQLAVAAGEECGEAHGVQREERVGQRAVAAFVAHALEGAAGGVLGQ